MYSRKERLLVLLCILLTGGMIFQVPGLTCASFASETAVSAVNFCFLFDCQGGAIGGLVDPCSPTFNLFVDCPPNTP